MEHGLSFYFQRHWCVSIGIVHLKPKCRGRRCRGRQCTRSCHYPPPPRRRRRRGHRRGGGGGRRRRLGGAAAVVDLRLFIRVFCDVPLRRL